MSDLPSLDVPVVPATSSGIGHWTWILEATRTRTIAALDGVTHT